MYDLVQSFEREIENLKPINKIEIFRCIRIAKNAINRSINDLKSQLSDMKFENANANKLSEDDATDFHGQNGYGERNNPENIQKEFDITNSEEIYFISNKKISSQASNFHDKRNSYEESEISKGSLSLSVFEENKQELNEDLYLDMFIELYNETFSENF